MPQIDWSIPQPAKGIRGAVERLTGPGATGAELVLQFSSAAAGALTAGYWFARAGDGAAWQVLLAAVLGFDIAGGVVTNATSSAKRWYHRGGLHFAHHLGFVLVHLLHLAAVAYLILPGSTHYFITGAVLLVSAATVILRVPRYLQRPVALALYALIVAISPQLLPDPAGMEWFIPLFFLKLLVSHLVVEEPYRPEND